MSVASQPSLNAANPVTRAFIVSSGATVLVIVAFLIVFGVSPIPFVLATGALLILWLVCRHPVGSLGIFLMFIPVFTLTFLLAKFFGPPYVAWLQGSDRAALLLVTVVLWWRNGIKLSTPDWFLLACFGAAILRLAFGGTLIGLLTDFSFMIAYAAGRMTVLTTDQEKLWARRAVWTVAVLSVLGMIEVFFIGEGPRTLLYLSAAAGGTQGGALDAAFHGEGYLGLRESSTMFGPLQFAPLCMAGLILWWVYCRDRIPGIMIAAGLICSVTRSAWVGTALAVGVLALLMQQAKRFLLYTALALGLFLAAIPILGLGDYLFTTKTGQDPSAQGHRESIFEGLKYVSNHPLGIGPGNVGKYAVKNDYAAAGFENTYLTFAAEYGIANALCFIGFLASLLMMLLRARTQSAYVAIGIVVGFSAIMMFAALHDVFPLACWLWFPVGLAIRSSVKQSDSEAFAASA